MAKTIKGSGTRIDGQGSNWIRRSTRWAIYARDGFCCAYCGRKPRGAKDLDRLTLDHINPITGVGDNRPENLITCCRVCNSAKSNLNAKGWSTYLAKIRTRLSARAIFVLICRQAKQPLDRAAGRRLAEIESTHGYLAAIG